MMKMMKMPMQRSSQRFFVWRSSQHDADSEKMMKEEEADEAYHSMVKKMAWKATTAKLKRGSRALQENKTDTEPSQTQRPGAGLDRRKKREERCEETQTDPKNERRNSEAKWKEAREQSLASERSKRCRQHSRKETNGNENEVNWKRGCPSNQLLAILISEAIRVT